jgi:hypothetical protein
MLLKDNGILGYKRGKTYGEKRVDYKTGHFECSL